MIINNASSVFGPNQIKIIEYKYSAKYVAEMPIKDANGNWVNFPCAIFYCKEKHPDGSNYFALYTNPGDGKLYVCDGISATKGTLQGIVADNGEVIYSRYRHDYRTSTDGSVTIDGGRDYLKCTTKSEVVELAVVEGELKVIANENSKA